MIWNLSIVAIPNTPGNKLVAAIYKRSTPTILADSAVLTEPYLGDPELISFLNVDPVVYNFKLWESADGSPSGILRNFFSLQPTNATINVRGNLYLITGVSAGLVAGTNSYVDSSLAGWTYAVERVPGTMFPDLDYAVDMAGGFHLLLSGDVFNPMERFVLWFTPQVQQIDPNVTTNDIISGLDLITADIALDSTAIGRGKLIQGASEWVVIKMPDLATVPENKPINFYSQGGIHTSAIFLPADSTSDEFLWPDTGQIVILQSTQLKIFKAIGKWIIDYISPDALMAGSIIYDMVTSRKNTVFANGALVSRLQYASLWKFVEDNSALMVTEAHWADTQTINEKVYNKNMGKYSDGDGVNTFRLPQLYRYSSLRLVSSNAGAVMPDQVGQFRLTLIGPVMTKAGNSNQVVVLGNINDGDLGTRSVDMGLINEGLDNLTPGTAVYASIRL